MDLSGKTYSKCREAIKRGQEKAATEGCGFLLLSDIVHSYLYFALVVVVVSHLGVMYTSYKCTYYVFLCE